jgi:hypothetical protein
VRFFVFSRNNDWWIEDVFLGDEQKMMTSPIYVIPFFCDDKSRHLSERELRYIFHSRTLCVFFFIDVGF